MQNFRRSAAKRDRLLNLLRGYGSCAVAFSGGLDSTVLAKAAQLALGDRAVAVTGRSASMAGGELDEAGELARQIGIRHEVVETGELSIPAYRANRADRCYHCKTELFAQVEQVAKRLGVAVVADGSNRDDLGDYRPGRKAAGEKNVKSPLGRVRFQQGRDSPIGRGVGVAHLGQAGHALSEQPHRLRRRGHARAAGDDRPGRAISARSRFSAAAGAVSQGRRGADRSRRSSSCRSSPTSRFAAR